MSEFNWREYTRQFIDLATREDLIFLGDRIEERPSGLLYATQPAINRLKKIMNDETTKRCDLNQFLVCQFQNKILISGWY